MRRKRGVACVYLDVYAVMSHAEVVQSFTSVVSRQANGLGAASSVKRSMDILLDRSVVYHEDGA